MNCNVYVFFVTILINNIEAVIYYLNETEYNRMPPVYKLDDYRACLQQPGGLYCTVQFNLISDTESELLTLIQEYSEQSRTHYNHSRLTHGICVTERCRSHIQDTNVVQNTSLEKCLNNTFIKEYTLSTQVTNFNCYNRSDVKAEFDTLDKAVALVLSVILTLNVFATLYDLQYRKKSTEDNFLLCFSLPRNWKRLVSYERDSESPIKSFKALNGIRCIILFGVVMVHSTWPMIRAGENSHHVELMYYKLRQNFLLSGSLAIQSTILVSGFLLAYNMEVYSENNNIDWHVIPKNILLRYLRLTPVYAVVVAFSSSWIKFIERGPLWQVSVHHLFSHCRSDWWRNLLYINNYKYFSICIVPTWYLAVDMQLFCLGTTLLVLLRNKSLRTPVLSIILLLGIIAIAVHTYVRDLNAIFIISPQECSELFRTDSTFNETYKMTHTNIPSFIIGMMAGYYVYKWQKAGVKVSKNSALRYIYWSLVPLGGIVLFSGEVFYRDSPRDNVAVRAGYAAISKPLFSTLLALLVAGTIFRTENVYRKVLESDVWTIPSRLSYCVFLVNFILINLYVGTIQSLVEVSNSTMVLLTVYTTAASFVASVPLWLLVETPFTKLAKYYFDRTGQKKRNKNECKNWKQRTFINVISFASPYKINLEYID